MQFLFKLAQTTPPSIDRINRWLVCEGYPPTFVGSTLAAPFVTESLIAAKIAEINQSDAFPDLPRPLTPLDYQAHFPLHQPGLCSINLDSLYPHALTALASLFNWAIAHPSLVTTCVLQNQQWLPTPPLDPLPSHVRHALLTHKIPHSHTRTFNQLLNYTQNFVLPQPTILFLFHAHLILTSTGTLPNATAKALNLICQKYDCSYAISSSNHLLFGKDPLIPCNPTLYL